MTKAASDEPVVPSDRRKENVELQATAKAMTAAVTESAAKLAVVDEHLQITAREATERIAVVNRQQRLVKFLLIVLLIMTIVLVALTIQQRKTSRDNRRVLNRINTCLNDITACVRNPSK